MFVAVLREGLKGLPHDVVADIVGDYEAHFTEGETRGRSEAELVDALGDPARLARELGAEIRVRRWQEKRSPAAAVGAVTAFLGLGAIDLLVVLPLVLVVAAILLAFFVTAIGVLCSGMFMLVSPLLAKLLGGPFGEQVARLVAQTGDSAIALLGVSLLAGSASVIAGLIWLGVTIVNVTVWFGRLHYRLVRQPVHEAAQARITKLTVIGP